MKRILRILVWGFLPLLVGAVILPAFGLGGIKVIGSLLFGWLGFLRRVAPEISVNWSGLGMVVVCSLLIVAGVHWLCGWIYSHNSPAEEHHGRKWRWQWSLSLYAALWLLFLAAMGITGFVHQLGWMMTSKEPIMVERRHSGITRMHLREAAVQIVAAADDTDWDLVATRKAFFVGSARFGGRRGSAVEDLHVLFLPGKQDKLKAAVVFHREIAQQERAGFLVVRDQLGNSEEEHPMRELSEVLARFSRETKANSITNE